MGLERLNQLFTETRTRGYPAYLPFITAGLPSPELSAQVVSTLLQSGADGLELGIPYPDPIMDGPIIRQASEQAIAAGTTPEVALSILSEVRTEHPDPPMVVMTYYNPILQWGISQFCTAVAEAGGDGLIVADLPVDEAEPLAEACRQHDLGMVMFLAPTSGPERIAKVAASNPAFIYVVADMGVTGKRVKAGLNPLEIIDRIRSQTSLPLVTGVGISEPEQVTAIAPSVDGIIVGSALVETMQQPQELADNLALLHHTSAQLAAARIPPS